MAGLAATLLLCSCAAEERHPRAAGDPAGEDASGTTAPVLPPGPDDAGARFRPGLFDETSAAIDNPWWPHVPGMQFTYEGHALDGTETIVRRVVATVTDLSKEVAGVRALLVWERDYSDGALVEAELSFRAQDVAGNVWHLGEYTEVYEDAEYVGNRVWVPGDPRGAQAGILMPADPKPGDPSFSEGFAPAPWNWNDRGRVRAMAGQECVRAGCFSDVLVVEEFEPSVPGAFQLKSYARGVGHLRVGWDGPNETEQEQLDLVEQIHLEPGQMAAARAGALAMENRATAYGRLGPAQPLNEGP